MGNRLRQILTFTNIGAGASSAQAATLVINGISKIPDKIYLDNASFDVVSCTATLLTVINNGAGVGSCDVYLEHEHSYDREYGNVAIQQLTPAPFIVRGSGGSGGSGPDPGNSSCVIFQPGSGQAGPGTFDTWAGVMAQLAAYRAAANGDGCYTIKFDDSTVSPCVIPAGGPYPMENVTWAGDGTNFGSYVSIADGASFTRLREFTNNLAVTNLNTVTSPCADLAAGDIIRISDFTDLTTTLGGVAMFDGTAVPAANSVFVIMTESSNLGFYAAGPVFSMPTAGSLLIVLCDDLSTPVAGTPGPFSGGVGAILRIETPSLGNIPTVNAAAYPGWAGTFNSPVITAPPSFLPKPYLTVPSAVALSAFRNDWLRLNASGGAIIQPLPSIPAASSSRFPGCMVVVTEEGGGTGLTITPAAGNTINGSASAVPVPANGALILISNGVSNWKIVAGAGALAGPGDSQCLIFQPGGGQVGPGTFASWPALMAQLAAYRAQANGGGCYTIEFDDTFTSPAVIPVGGPYDMEDVTWSGGTAVTPGLGFRLVEIADGASFTGLRRFTTNLFVLNANTVTSPCADIVDADIITLDDGALLETTGSASFFRWGGGVDGGATLNVYRRSSLVFGPIFHFPVTDGLTLVVATEDVAIFSAVTGKRAPIRSGSVFTSVVGNDLVIQSPDLANIPTVFPGWLGTITVDVPGVPPSLLPKPYLTAASAVAVGAPFSSWARLTTAGGAIATPLPSINAAPATFGQPGCFVLVSEQGGGQQLTVTPAGGDTINGSASAVQVPANGSVLFISDGVSNWAIAADRANQRFSPPEQWAQQNVVASQTNVALSAQVSTNFDNIKMIRAGSIVGLSTRLTETITVGTLTVQVTINGAGGTLLLVHTSVSNPSGGQVTQRAGIDRFVAADLIGIRLTTDAGFLPITTDLESWLEIEEVP
jgi:hypothetical protein